MGSFDKLVKSTGSFNMDVAGGALNAILSSIVEDPPGGAILGGPFASAPIDLRLFNVAPNEAPGGPLADPGGPLAQGGCY